MSKAVEVIGQLDEVLKTLEGSKRKAVEAERNYLENNRNRLDYAGAKERGEPLSSGAMESTKRRTKWSPLTFRRVASSGAIGL